MTQSIRAMRHLVRIWPRKLMTRLFLIFFVGLLLAHAMSFALLFYERYDATKSMMVGDLERELSIAAITLDRLSPAERPEWLTRLSSGNRQYRLGPGEADQPLQLASARAAAESISTALSSFYPVVFHAMAGDDRFIQARITLSDGSTIVRDIHAAMPPLAGWLPVVLAMQLALLVACAWLAVRLAVRPLTRLAKAADSMDVDQVSPRLNERGPIEVAQAAIAFNAMQDRIGSYLKERMQLLGAISHDLQTPITRMKLRAEFMDDSVDKIKLTQDLAEVERLVREGIDYARSAHGTEEKCVRIDANAFLDSIVCDYQDTGQQVSFSAQHFGILETRPHALRRVLCNLIDNALKFAGAAEVRIEGSGPREVSIVVLDRGPGIAAVELEAVFQPFYRLELSRNRDTGGTGLGLAIARQLVIVLGGSLVLSNRDGGGLAAEVRIPDNQR